ncbi:MAG: hypothetical protein KDD22_06845, partial [Bdellovibrionales bacterium]|nr:hypothetical protein [Bdellovibrionales bacterium]
LRGFHTPEKKQTLPELFRQSSLLQKKIPAAQEQELALLAINTWIHGIDPFSHVSLPESEESSVKVYELTRDTDDRAILKINTFVSRDLCSNLQPILRDLEKDSSINSLVIDLRGNLGGYLESALCMADMFLPPDMLLVTLERTDIKWPFKVEESWLWQPKLSEVLGLNHRERRSQTPPVFTKSLEIWVDQKSASSSEVFTASLQDHQRALVKGHQSFGKSTAQLPMKISGLGQVSAFLTVYRWVRPSSSKTAQFVGILPDVSSNL